MTENHALGRKSQLAQFCEKCGGIGTCFNVNHNRNVSRYSCTGTGGKKPQIAGRQIFLIQSHFYNAGMNTGLGGFF